MLGNYMLGVLHGSQRGAERRGLGRVDKDHHVTLILVGEKSLGKRVPPYGDTYAHRCDEHCRAHGVEDEYSGALLIAANHPLYPAVETGKESMPLLLAGTEKQGTECGR